MYRHCPDHFLIDWLVVRLLAECELVPLAQGINSLSCGGSAGEAGATVTWEPLRVLTRAFLMFG
jgi:hypothetical protein